MKRLSTFLFSIFAIVVVCYAEPVRILGIGNSFTVDALEQHFQPLLTAENQDAIIGYPYRGGTWLNQHDKWTRQDTLPYNYRKFKNGNFTSTGLATYSLRMALQDEPWDYVIIQSDHDSAGIYKSYVPYIERLIKFVEDNCSNPNVKIGFYMTWAYDKTSTYGSFALYNKDQQVMYDSIINATKKVLANHPKLTVYIPCGTAVQNARTSYMQERMNRDGYHLHYNHGRYVAALSWYEVIFGKSALDVTWKPSSITDYCAEMCRNAVHAAVLKPYEVTSLAANFGEPEHETIAPGTESHLRRITVNGMNVPLTEETTYTVPVDYTISPVALYAYPIDTKAELNITDIHGSDIEKDPSKPWYYPLATPAKGATVKYTVRVISEAMGSDETIYTLNLKGVESSSLVYPISSREDLENFAAAVNGGSYGLKAEVTEDFNTDHTKQDCWMTPIGTKAHPYTGTFDGKGHTISGFNIYSVDNDLQKNVQYVGLFGYVKNALIKNVHIVGTEESYFNRITGTDANDMSDRSYGLLCGIMEASTVQDCSVSMPIFTNVAGYVGALVGGVAGVSGSAASVIERCSAEGTWRIRHSGIYGGILGYGYNCVIRDCYSLCNMSLQQDKKARIGGILGYMSVTTSNRSAKLTNCYSYGKLTDDRVKYGATTAQALYIGAIASVFNGPEQKATNCWYLENSAPAIFGQTNTSETATVATKTQFANGTVTAALGAAWEQGENYPLLKAPEITTGIETAAQDQSDSPTRKFLRNGQLLILHNGISYTVTGQVVR